MRKARIGVADLMLHGNNPRHTRVVEQREAIQALLADDGADKLLALATDIGDHGLSPIDVFMVVPNDRGGFTVLEGNRRIAALKLLINPALADGHPVEARFRALAQKVTPLAEVQCVVAASVEEGRHWLELRHTGEHGGAGVVQWSAEAKQRFDRQRGSQADKALAFLDAVQQAYPHNPSMQSDLDVVRKGSSRPSAAGSATRTCGRSTVSRSTKARSCPTIRSRIWSRRSPP